MEYEYDSKLDRGINEDLALLMIKLTGSLFLREATFPGFHNPHLKHAPPYRAAAASEVLKIMVEYNGPYHYTPDNWQRTRNDVLKRRWCRLHGYLQIVVTHSVSKAQLERYLRFRLLTNTGVDPTPASSQSRPPHRTPSAPRRHDSIYILDAELPALLPESVDLARVESNAEADEYLMRYRLRKEHVLDPATKTFLLAYDESSVGEDYYGYFSVKFWTTYPSNNIKTPGVFHVPAFLFRGDRKIARYLAARLLDGIDQATLFWKINNVFQVQGNVYDQ